MNSHIQAEHSQDNAYPLVDEGTKISEETDMTCAPQATESSTGEPALDSLTLVPMSRSERKTHVSSEPVLDYSIECSSVPTDQDLKLVGPGQGLRLRRIGTPDFFSISEIAKSLLKPGMSELERARAVYRFSMRHTYHMSIGFGGTEMNRFLNGVGYSFCYGQADFQHLLYEAMGLRVRAPNLKGHSSVEVLLDGRWTTWDAFSCTLLPSPDLSGLATGADLRSHPEIFDAVYPERIALQLKNYWSEADDGSDSSEPWQDSRAMTLNLRRGESVSFRQDSRDNWCLSRHEPPKDTVCGEWHWQPVLDDTFLTKETTFVEGVSLEEEKLVGHTGIIEFQLHTPWPIIEGNIAVQSQKATQIFGSKDHGRSWHQLVPEKQGGTWSLPKELVSVKQLGAEISDVVHLTHHSVNTVLIRVENISGELSSLSADILVQAHSRSLPWLSTGENKFQFIGGQEGAKVVQVYSSAPGLIVSNHCPVAGEEVTFSAELAANSPVTGMDAVLQLCQRGNGLVLSESPMPSTIVGATEKVSMTWTAEAHGDRPGRPGENGSASCYVSTRIDLLLVSDEEETVLGTTELTVRPRPCPKVGEALTWSGRTSEGCVVRVVVSNMPAMVGDATEHVYVTDTPLHATASIYCNHPDHGGRLISEPLSTAPILPFEFEVLEWTFPKTVTLEERLWAVIESHEPVAPEDQRQVVPIRRAKDSME